MLYGLEVEDEDLRDPGGGRMKKERRKPKKKKNRNRSHPKNHNNYM